MNGKELAKQTLDQIPQVNANAKRIVGLVKESGKITGYQLSDNSTVEKQQAVDMAKQGQIAGVGIAHRGDAYAGPVVQAFRRSLCIDSGLVVHACR